MSDTPRTDANTIRIEFGDGPFKSVTYVPVEFSKTLERALAAVTAERNKLRGIIYRATVAKVCAETDPLAFVPAQDIEDSIAIVRDYRK